MLLDNEQVKLVCLFANHYKKSDEGTITEGVLSQHVVAVALLIVEGSTCDNMIEAPLINAVNHGKKRLKNHFVPQSLLTQCGIERAFTYHYMRVMRIAVHPQVQQQGLGSYFLSKISEFSTAQGADFLASSFGATKSLLSFWLKNDFRIARIGFTQDKASGEQSSLVLKALTTSGEAELTGIVNEFYRSFDYLLTEEYKQLAVDLVLLILSDCPLNECSILSARDKANIVAFAEGYRQYSSCVFSLHLWLKQQLSGISILDESNYMVLISRIMQKHSVIDVCNTYGITGKRELEQLLRSKVRQLL
ncbi:GNAT family N-acetyltransferase [Colwellia sp. MSW7]|uniref:GNAT family N-acetyltransferase n=2 Tax=Colwellia maritima TaxID=2912588 RepID=A0ABS9X373_9GAMM|nr:GNAT family N-acetyltransferase [Colwellia maritima]